MFKTFKMSLSLTLRTEHNPCDVLRKNTHTFVLIHISGKKLIMKKIAVNHYRHIPCDYLYFKFFFNWCFFIRNISLVDLFLSTATDNECFFHFKHKYFCSIFHVWKLRYEDISLVIHIEKGNIHFQKEEFNSMCSI